MGRTFKQLHAELLDNFPDMNTFQAKIYVNRAWKDVRDSRQWSFLVKEGVLFSPAAIATGTFSITQFSASVQASAAAITALTGLTSPVITKRQIRFSSGPIYNISTYVDGTGAMTLDRIVRETTDTAAAYSLYRCYYGLPEDGTGAEVSDFLRYNSIYNPQISDYFRGINQDRTLLNRIDPQRSNVGNNPYYMFSYKGDSSNNPQWEMWPHPTAAGAYLCSYQQRGIDLTDTDTLPAVIPDQLVLEKAMSYGCEWAYKNSARYPNLKGVNWLLMKERHDKVYSNVSSKETGMLEVAQRNDEEMFPMNNIIDYRSYTNGPVGDDLRNGYYSITP